MNLRSPRNSGAHDCPKVSVLWCRAQLKAQRQVEEILAEEIDSMNNTNMLLDVVV